MLCAAAPAGRRIGPVRPLPSPPPTHQPTLTTCRPATTANRATRPPPPRPSARRTTPAALRVRRMARRIAAGTGAWSPRVVGHEHSPHCRRPTANPNVRPPIPPPTPQTQSRSSTCQDAWASSDARPPCRPSACAYSPPHLSRPHQISPIPPSPHPRESVRTHTVPAARPSPPRRQPPRNPPNLPDILSDERRIASRSSAVARVDRAAVTARARHVLEHVDTTQAEQWMRVHTPCCRLARWTPHPR